MANPFGVSNSGGVPAAYNYGSIRNALNMRVGQAESGELLSAEEMDECLEAARREINMIRPMWYFSSFAVQNGVQRYAASSVLPNNFLGKVTVFWFGGSSGACNTLGIFQQYGDIYAFLFGNLVNFTGQFIDQTRIYESFKQYSTIRRWFGGRAWLERDGYIWLEPVPTANDVVYFAAKVPRFPTVLSLDEEYAEPFFDFAEFKACTILALKQSEVAQATYGPGKGVDTAGGRIYADRAKQAERRFYDAMKEPGGARKIFNF